jgi:putative integral membrane protein (TIGR02587 family)
MLSVVASVDVSSAKSAAVKGDRFGLAQEGKDLLAAITGGAIVGMPLLYTMEMWFHGMTLGPVHQLGLLGAILLVNLLFNVVSGFRHEYGFASAVLESVTAVGIGMLFSAFILWLIGEIGPGDAFGDVLGKVLFESAAVSLGVSVADAYVRGKNRRGDEQQDLTNERPGRAELERRQIKQDIRDFSATIAGAVLFSINLGPTEEVLVIAARLAPEQLLLIVLASLGLCYVILFASGIRDQPVHVRSLVQSPAAETILTYSASLAVALGLLWFLGEREALGGFGNLLAATVVLALPTAIGGAAGRLVL